MVIVKIKDEIMTLGVTSWEPEDDEDDVDSDEDFDYDYDIEYDEE